MTTQKTIGQLTELTAANTTDVVPIVDNSGQSGVTKRITVQNAFKSVPAGQAATPGLAFSGDVDTGISRVGADQLALCTGGQARLTVGATGDITIGSNLIVDGTTTTISSETLLVEDKNIELGTVASPSDATADGGGITLKGATDKTITWVNSTGAWTFNQPVNVTGGDVGIGTTSPDAKLTIQAESGVPTLHLSGSPNVGDTTDIALSANAVIRGESSIRSVINNNGYFSWSVGGTDNLAGTSGSTERLRIDSAGNLLIKTGEIDLQGGNKTIKTSAGFLQVGTSGSHHTAFIIGGTERMRIDSSGRLLINNDQNASTYPLQVTAQTDANAICIIGRASDDIGELKWFENDRTTSLGEIQYRQDHVNFRHRVGEIRFATGGTTNKMILDSDGRLLVGLASPIADGYLEVKADSDRVNTLVLWGQDTTSEYLGLGVSSDGSTITAGGAGSTSNSLIFRTAFSGSEEERMRIDSSGKMQIAVTGGDSTSGLISIGNDSADGTVDFSKGLQFLDTTNNNSHNPWSHAGICATGSTNYAGNLVFGTDPGGSQNQGGIQERVRIDTLGTLLVGGTSTADDNHANINTNGVLTIRRAAASNDCILIKEGSTTSLLIEADGFVANYNVGTSAFTSYDNEAGVSGPYAAMGAASGEARITAGSTASDNVPLVFRTSSSGTETEEMRLLPGGGLTFNGDTAQANALDDYEEGTWTPVWGSTTGSFGSITYTFQNGRYTKIGDRVFVDCRLRSSALAYGTAGGSLLVSGLPYTNNSSQLTGGSPSLYNINVPAGTVNIATEGRENATSFYAGLATRDDNSFLNISATDVDTGLSIIRVSFVYRTNS